MKKLTKAGQARVADILLDTYFRIYGPAFSVEVIKDPVNFSHNLGVIKTPEEMALAEHADKDTDAIGRTAKKALEALAGSGPRQLAPHTTTASVLATGLHRLRDHALAGDQVALNLYADLIWYAVADLNEMARRNPEIVQKWSRKKYMVPVLVGRNAGHKTALEESLKTFDVGSETKLRINPRRVRGGGSLNSTSPAVALASELCEYVNKFRIPSLKHAAKAPRWVKLAANLRDDLNRGNLDAWTEATFECLDAATGKDLSKYSDLGDVSENDGPGGQRRTIRGRLKKALGMLASRTV